MIGPFPNPVFKFFVTSPLGLREKKTPGKFRVIHDLSASFGGPSVNSHIPVEAGTVSYDTVDTAIALIQSIGPGAFLAKTDIEHAYMLIPIHPDDIPALGIRWFKDWFCDCTLPMGSRSGCAISETFSDAIQLLAEARGCGKMNHVLDDFLMVSAIKSQSDVRLSCFLSLCELLGIPVVCEKTESGTCIIFLCITLDTIKMEARLPQDKLAKCLRLVNTYRGLNKITINQLESLTGLLNFACKVIHPYTLAGPSSGDSTAFWNVSEDGSHSSKYGSQQERRKISGCGICSFKNTMASPCFYLLGSTHNKPCPYK